MAKQPIKQKVATLDELPAFETATVDELPDFGEPVKKKGQPQLVKQNTSVSKSVSAPTKPSLVLPSKEVEKPEEVGYVEDLWNRFKGSGTKVLSAFLNVPSAAQSYIYDVALAATGKDEEFNRLPAAAKREVKSAVRAINKGLPNGEFLYQTKEAANYLNKKAENIYQRTIQDETSLSDEISKLATNPTSEGVLKIINKSIRSTAESLPYMGISMVPGGAAAIGVATAAEKREQELEDTGNYGMGFLINSAVTGGSNYLGEKYTGRILNKIGAKAIGNPELVKKVTQTPLKELGKDLGIEFTTGGLQSFTQEVSDKWTKGQDVEWIPTLKKALDDALLESASVGTFAAAGQGVSGTRKLTAPLKRYLATKIIAKEDASYIKKGVDAIQDLTTQKADDQDPIVNEAIDNKIDEIKTNIAGKLQMAEDMVDNLSNEDIKKTIQIDRDLEDVRLKAKAIKDNPTLDDATKETLRKDLANKYINLNQEKNAIQEQATSKVSVQPEAGVSGEVAEGVSQAEPQGPTEEVKVEEVVNPTETIEVFHGGDLPSLEEGRPLYVSEDASQANEYAKMSKGEVSKFFLDKNKIADEEDAYAIMEELGLPTDANFFELIDPRFDEALPKEDIKKVFDTLKQKGFEAVRYTDIDQKDLKSGIQNILVLDAFKSLKTEPIVTEEQVKPTEMSREEWTKIQYLADRISNGEEITLPEDLQLQKNYPQTIEKLLESKAKPVSQQPLTEITKLSDEQKSAIQEGVKLGNDMVKRYPKQDDLIIKYKALQKFQKKNQQYIDANQSQRDEMTRQINFALGLAKKKSAQSAKSILGIKPRMITVDEMKSLKEQLLLQEKAAKSGVDFANKAKKLVNDTIKGMKKGALDSKATNSLLTALNANAETPEQRRDIISKVIATLKGTEGKIAIDELKALKDQIKLEAKAAKGGADFVKRITKSVGETLPLLVKKGSITPAQQKTIFRGLKANLVNPVMLNRFFDKVDRIMGVADYKEKLRQANALRTKLSKASERKGAKTELKDITKALSKVQPNMLNDIDEFISRAKEALSAMSPSKVDQDSTLIDFKNYTKYTKKLLDAQEKALQQYKEAEYRSLQDQGLIDPDMSLADIEAYLKQAAEDEKFQEKAKVEKDLAEYAKASFENSKEIIQQMIYEEEISEEDLPLIQGFMLIDTDIMNPKMAVKAADELRNYIHNGSKTGMGKIFKDYLGAVGAKAMAENTTVNKVLSVGGIKNLVLKGIDAVTGYVAGKFDLQGTNLSKWYSDAWLEYVSQIDNVGVTAMGEKNWLKFKKLSGFDEIVEGFVRNKKEIDRFTKEFVKKYENKKVDGRKVFTKYNATQAGIIADFYRETGDTPEEVAENFEKRKKILEEAIDYTKDKLRFKVDHKIMKELYDKLGIEKATNGQEVFNNAPKLMQDVVSDMVGEWSKYFPASQRVAEEQYGILLGQNKNYTPYRWTVVSNKISDSDPLYDKGGYVSDFDILDTEEAGTFKKLKFPDKLPTINGEVVRIPNYNFFQNNIDALTQTGNNINTIAGVNQFNGFIKSKYMKDIIKDDDSRNLLIKRMTYNINKLTDREKISTNSFQRGILKLINVFSGLGTRLGLGAITSPGTQALPALTNTFFNLGNPAQMARSMVMLANPANRQWLDNLEETISERGKESTTSIDYANKLLANKDLGKVGDIIDGIAEVSKFYVDTLLVKSDVAAAKISWLSYYLDALENKGVDISKLKLSETQVDKEAAKIADRKVQREQNINIAELSGKLFSSKSTGLRLLRSSLLAFQSYTISSRDKMKTNMSILFNPNSLSTVEEKMDAIDSIAATIAEQWAFSSLKAGIRNIVIAGAYAAVGEEETEEEKKLREKRNRENTELNIFQALTGSFGVGDQEWDLDAINFMLDYFQGTIDEQEVERRIQEQEEKDMMDEERDSEFTVKLTPEEKKAERLQRSLDRPFRFYTGVDENDGRLAKYSRYLGSTRVLFDVIDRVVLDTKNDLERGGYYDKRGNFIEYNEDQIEKLKMLKDASYFQLFGLPPSEVKTMTNEMKKIMKDRAYLNKMIDKDEERKAKLEQ